MGTSVNDNSLLCIVSYKSSLHTNTCDALTGTPVFLAVFEEEDFEDDAAIFLLIMIGEIFYL